MSNYDLHADLACVTKQLDEALHKNKSLRKKNLNLKTDLAKCNKKLNQCNEDLEECNEAFEIACGEIEHAHFHMKEFKEKYNKLLEEYNINEEALSDACCRILNTSEQLIEKALECDIIESKFKQYQEEQSIEYAILENKFKETEEENRKLKALLAKTANAIVYDPIEREHKKRKLDKLRKRAHSPMHY